MYRVTIAKNNFRMIRGIGMSVTSADLKFAKTADPATRESMVEVQNAANVHLDS